MFPRLRRDGGYADGRDPSSIPAGQPAGLDGGAPRNRSAYTVEKCASGLTLCRGEIADAPAADVALRLSEKFAAHLIVDFRRLGQSLTGGLESGRVLVRLVRAGCGGGGVAGPDLARRFGDLARAARRGLGQRRRGLPVLQSGYGGSLGTSRAARAAPRGTATAPPTAVLGFCWPSVLVALLSHHAAYSNQLFEGIDAILTEFPDLPDTWQLFGDRPFPAVSTSLGFEREQAEESSVARESQVRRISECRNERVGVRCAQAGRLKCPLKGSIRRAMRQRAPPCRAFIRQRESIPAEATGGRHMDWLCDDGRIRWIGK